MKEEYLHYIWRYGLFDFKNLYTTSGEPISIISKGTYNQHAGPDFLNARIRIGQTEWVGNVELHVKSSDWNKHNHQNDSAYNNVILHVVLLDDSHISNELGSTFPTLSLSTRIHTDHFNRYKNLVSNSFKIPCQNQVSEIDDITRVMAIERMGISRLERKSLDVIRELRQSKFNWNQVYFQLLAKNFGMKVNAMPFEFLAKSVPLNVIAKHLDQPTQVESLLFGQAGLLNESFEDEYPRTLYREYQFLRKKYDLNSIEGTSWKFMRMRPSNFPTIRIAQLSAYLIKNKGLIDLNFENFNVYQLRESFKIELPIYWENRYQFDKISVRRSKTFGKSSFYNVVINTVVPVMFAFGIVKNDQRIKDLALNILTEIPPEQNSLIKYWNEIGFSAYNAFDSQALIELRNQQCIQKKCLTCNIGISLLKDAVLND